MVLNSVDQCKLYTLCFIDNKQTIVRKNVISRTLEDVLKFGSEMWRKKALLLVKLIEINSIPNGFEVKEVPVEFSITQDASGKACIEYQLSESPH